MNRYLFTTRHRSKSPQESEVREILVLLRGHLDHAHGMRVEDGLTEFTKLIRYNFANDPIVASTSFQFFGPLPPILAGRESKSPKIQLEGVEIILSEESIVGERSNDAIGTPVKIAYRQGKMEMKLQGPFEESSIKARRLADIVDQALSIFSQDTISWNREVSKRYNSHTQQIGEQELMRWAVQPKGVRTDYRATGSPLADSVGVLASAIAALPQDKFELFEKIFKCFQNAWMAPYFELWLVVWHACLDEFKNHYYPSKNPFSPNFVKACDRARVSFCDLFPGDRKLLLSRKENFLFNKLRNDYIHDGLVWGDFPTTMEEIRKMKALANRFLLRFLGLDEHFCNLDSTYIP